MYTPKYLLLIAVIGNVIANEIHEIKLCSKFFIPKSEFQNNFYAILNNYTVNLSIIQLPAWLLHQECYERHLVNQLHSSLLLAKHNGQTKVSAKEFTQITQVLNCTRTNN